MLHLAVIFYKYKFEKAELLEKQGDLKKKYSRLSCSSS